MGTDQRRNEDLTRLKSIGGLFVCAAELTYIIYTWRALILTFMKFIRLYYEVWYARDTCLSAPNCSEIFRLKQGCPTQTRQRANFCFLIISRSNAW